MKPYLRLEGISGSCDATVLKASGLGFNPNSHEILGLTCCSYSFHLSKVAALGPIEMLVRAELDSKHLAKRCATLILGQVLPPRINAKHEIREAN